MSSQVRELMASGFGQLRHEPTAKRIRAVLGGETVVDSTRALLVWEPRRVVPSYAVPAEDVRGDLVPAGPAGAAPGEDVGAAMPDVTRAAGPRPEDPVRRAQHRRRDRRPARGRARSGPARPSARPTRT